jgi:hypothetical protein
MAESKVAVVLVLDLDALGSLTLQLSQQGDRAPREQGHKDRNLDQRLAVPGDTPDLINGPSEKLESMGPMALLSEAAFAQV